MMRNAVVLMALFTNILFFAQKNNKVEKNNQENISSTEGIDMALLGKSMNLKEVVTSADTLPEFPGGMNLFYRKYAEAIETLDLKHNEKLDVKLYFIVEKSGYVNNITATGKNKKHNEEAVKGLRRIFARWKPATIDGKPVRYLYSFPLTSKQY